MNLSTLDAVLVPVGSTDADGISEVAADAGADAIAFVPRGEGP